MATYYVRPDGNNANAGTTDSAAGAWQTLTFALANAVNGVLANGDTVYGVADQGVYTENNVTIDRAIVFRGLRGTCTIDGTGGGAGSDGLIVNASATVIDVLIQNTVDAGARRASGTITFRKVRTQTTGGVGYGPAMNLWTLYHCSARSSGSNGYDSVNSPEFYFCEAADCTGYAFGNTSFAIGCLAYDCGGVGLTLTSSAGVRIVIGSTFEGNGGDGVDLGGVATVAFGSIFLNNIFSNNTGYGVDSSAGAQTTIAGALVDFNDFFGNSVDARRNFPTGANDLTVDPEYANASGDDYTPGAEEIIGGGYSPFKSGNLLNIGAVVHAAGSSASGAPGNLNGGIFQ